jgi:hypothetical protein
MGTGGTDQRRLLDNPPHGGFYFMPLGGDGDAG